MTNYEIDQSTPENFNEVTSNILIDAKDRYLSAQQLDLRSFGKSAMRYVKPTLQNNLDFDLRRILLRPNPRGNDVRNIHPSERSEVDPDSEDVTELSVIRAGIDDKLRRKVLSVYVPSLDGIVFTELRGALPFVLMSIDQMDGNKLQKGKHTLFVESNYAQLFRPRQLSRDIFDNDLIRQVANGDIDLDAAPPTFLNADVKTTIGSTTINYAKSSGLLLTFGEFISENIDEW
jgi:hypothetical protein